jgi:2-polyprenyl-6-hydroxyphenyl methylase/3-demethylubiquinone-9 3-methyltransferase
LTPVTIDCSEWYKSPQHCMAQRVLQRHVMNSATYKAGHWSQRSATDDSLREYLRDNHNPYNSTKADLLDRILGDVRGRELLDYGGGAGYFGLRCARRGARVTLVDPEQGALDLAQRLASTWRVADRLTTIRDSWVPRFDGRRFDVIVLKDVIEHVADDAGLLEHLASLQPPGSRLLLSTHNTWSLNNLIQGSYERFWCGNRAWCGWDPTHVRFYSPRSIGKLLRGAGYRPLRWASVFLVPYNIGSWLTLLRKEIEWPWLSQIDRLIGASPPFNRLGWNVLVCAERMGSVRGPA